MALDEARVALETPASLPFVVAASVQGPSHARGGTPCQDAWSSRALGSSVAFAVADGLGSASLAHEGARIAVDAAVAAAEGWDGDPMVLARAAREALEAADAELRALACTLIAGVVSADGCSLVHVGDGGVVLDAGPELVVASEPARSEYVDVVDPLTSDEWERNARVSVHEIAVRALVAFTDGCQRAALATVDGEPVAHRAFFEPLLAFIRDEGAGARDDLERFLAGPKMSDHSDDDKTLFVVTFA